MLRIAESPADVTGTSAAAGPAAQGGEPVAFLEMLTGGRGLVAVAAIIPDGPIEGDTFEMPSQKEALRSWIDARNGEANLYYSLNTPKPRDQQTGKAGKIMEADVVAYRGVVVDIDPDRAVESTEGGFERERARLLALARDRADDVMLAPAAIVDSGGGIQMVWLFPEPLPATPENRAAVKAQAVAMQDEFGGDPTQSLDHLFRLPGTVNIPNAKKMAKGRKRCDARLIHSDPDPRARVSLADLRYLATPDQRAAETSAPAELTNFDYDAVLAAAEDATALPPQLRQRIADWRAQSDAIDRIFASPDRSARDFALACYAIERGVTDPTELGQAVFSLSPEKLLEKDRGVSGLSDLEASGGGRGGEYALATIRAALKRAAPPPPPERFLEPVEDPAADGGARSERPRFKPAEIVRFPIAPAEIPRREWLVRPAIPRPDAVLLVGPPKAAKSAWSINLAFAVASGDPGFLFGREHRAPWRFKPGRILIVNNEDPTVEIKRRMNATVAACGDSPPSGSIVILSGADADSAPYTVLTKKDGKIETAPGFDHIAAEIVRHGADLVIFDSLVSLAAGLNENDNVEMDQLIRALRRLAAQSGAAALIIHHTGKRAGEAGDANSARGASSIYGAIRAGFTLLPVDEESRKKAGLPPGAYVRLDDSGGNYAAKDGLAHVWRKESGDVGNGGGESTGGADLFDVDDFDEAAGDTAPVFCYVGALDGFEKRKAATDDADRAASVALAVHRALGTDESRALDKGFKIAIGEELRKLAVIGGTSAATVDRALNSTIPAAGVEIATGGQTVRVFMTREGEGRTARRVLGRRVGRDKP
jgi:hypothetical protein